MKKIIITVCCALLVISGFTYLLLKMIQSNSVSISEKLPNPIPATAFYTDLEGFNYTFFKDISIQSTIIFQIISKAPIKNDDIKIELDKNIPIRYGIEKDITEYKFPYYIYQNYNNTNWKDLMILYSASISETGNKPGSKEKKAFETSVNLLMNSYNKIDLSKLKGMNVYRGYIAIDRLSENTDYSDVKQIKIVANGTEHVFNGSISFKSKPVIRTNGGLKIRTPGITDKPIVPCPEGLIFMSLNSEASVSKDITLTGFRILQEKINMVSTNIVITDSKGSMDIEFDGKPVEVKSGSGIAMNFIIRDKDFCRKLNYMSNAMVVIDYKAGNEAYSEIIDISYRRRQDPYEAVAIYNDKVDFSSYYFDFFDGVYHNH